MRMVMLWAELELRKGGRGRNEGGTLSDTWWWWYARAHGYGSKGGKSG